MCKTNTSDIFARSVISQQPNSLHYKLGEENKIAFAFSCPGRREEEAQPPGPAKDVTGKNLECLLRLMRKR